LIEICDRDKTTGFKLRNVIDNHMKKKKEKANDLEQTYMELEAH
jgi:hypothetical protein